MSSFIGEKKMKTLCPWPRWGLLAGVAMLLSSLPAQSNPVSPELPPQNSTPAFREGYIPGCAEGYWDGGRPGYAFALNEKDTKRYDSNPEYRKGWDQGRNACYVEQLRNPWMGGDGA